MRRARFALAGLVVVAASCRGNPEVTFEVVVPRSIVDSVRWIEVGAFRDGSCGALAPMLPAGIPVEGMAARVAFRPNEPARPRLGDIPTATYAFGAVARDEDCSVVATGCAEVDVSGERAVRIDLAPVDTPRGACGQGAKCDAARCVPANDIADPSIGAGCPLLLVGAGPLANPVGAGGSLLSPPAVAATDKGFVIAYREVDPAGGIAKVTVLPVDFGGGALTPLRPSLGARCSGSEESDGVGLVADPGGGGFVTLARAACPPERGAIEFIGFNPDFSVGKYIVSAALDDRTVLTMANAHAVAPRITGGYSVAFIENGVAKVAPADPLTGLGNEFGLFGATPPHTGAWIAASSRALALMAVGTGPLAQPPSDAGAPDGGTSQVDAGADEGVLRLHVVPAGTALNALGAPTATFPGSWGSLAVTGARVITVSEGASGGRGVTFRSFDVGKPAAVDTNGFSVEGLGKVLFADVAIAKDRVFFAVEKAGEISLVAYANATTIPTPLREVTFSREPRIPTVANVRDGRVAVAATETRVAVAWTTARVLTSNDAAGGYAVFACAD
ncbi:MAG: hypothetical protein R3B36_02420 [Polyangiaceae bacterium]